VTQNGFVEVQQVEASYLHMHTVDSNIINKTGHQLWDGTRGSNND